MTKEYIKHISGWENDYLKRMLLNNLSKQQIELLEGRPIKADEGMIYGQMYADWKSKAWNE